VCHRVPTLRKVIRNRTTQNKVVLSGSKPSWTTINVYNVQKCY